MKKITYKFISAVVDNEDVLLEKTLELTDAELEVALPFIEKEAYNGEYTVVDDGKPEPTAPYVTWDELAAAISEGVNSI